MAHIILHQGGRHTRSIVECNGSRVTITPLSHEVHTTRFVPGIVVVADAHKLHDNALEQLRCIAATATDLSHAINSIDELCSSRGLYIEGEDCPAKLVELPIKGC